MRFVRLAAIGATIAGVIWWGIRRVARPAQNGGQPTPSPGPRPEPRDG